MTDRNVIEKLVEQELREANKKYPLFHSSHEAFGVLMEEIDELSDDVIDIKVKLDEMWNYVREDVNIYGKAWQIHRIAISAVQEAIQVAAMFEKIKMSNLTEEE